ncbi:thiolase family protein [Arthrobacter bambusae]|uniref:thiolase family protein n=1 Tax=Arthrobacter bambusae TaxID=1338426 RepID=UPI00277D1ABB|nr:thiolase family protein [Arthrobacter bambusae]MDQ0242103.1 acetyl-CoA acetyltransferase [Arthrobacter bambusae]
MSGVDIIGVGLSRFGRQPGVSGRAMALDAIAAALADAALAWEDIQAAYGGSDSSGLADTLVSDLGMTGIPFTNVKNGCATGGSALVAGYNAILAGSAETVLVVGFDKHPRGAFDPIPADWGLSDETGHAGLMVTTQFFGSKIQRYMYDYGISARTLALVPEKSSYNGNLNPNAWRRDQLTPEQILSSTMVSDPLTQFMFCSPGEGAAAVILSRAGRNLPQGVIPVHVAGAVSNSRTYGSFEVFSPWLPPGDLTSVSTRTASKAFEMAGIGPEDVQVAQLQDTDSGAEIMHMAECGFCVDGEQEKLLDERYTWIGGKLPVNTDGGCLANGEPIGASGLRQIHEIVTQLRGRGGARQVPGNPRIGFTHVYGAPGVSACTVLEV